MRTFLLAGATALSLTAMATAPAPSRTAANTNAFPFMPKAQSELRENGFGHPDRSAKEQKGAARISAAQRLTSNQLPTGDITGYLDGPDMTTWFYTMSYDKTIIDHGAYKETQISGYHITVYNAAFEEVGKIEDTITLGEGETRVAQVEVASQVTKKFFNTDNNFEVMVALSINTVEYVNHTFTRVYSLGKSEMLTTIPGYYVSAVNTATDQWSEHFWFTFLTDEETQTPTVGNVTNVSDYVYTTYKYAGYSGMGDPVLTLRVPTLTVSGENAVPFLATQHDGKPYFALNRMKYCWFEDPFDFSNENPTPDNELIVDLYTTESAWSNNIVKYSTTRIPSEATIDNRYFLYVGAFSYMDDINFGRYTTDGNPSFIVTREEYVSASDSYRYTYDVYTTPPEGEDGTGMKKLNLATNVDGGYFMSDVPGFDPQVMFVKTNGTDYFYDFTSLITGEIEQTLPVYITDDVTLSASTDRMPDGDSYLYVSSATHGYTGDDGNVYHNVNYITPEGEVDHIDRLNLGKNIDLAQVYMGVDAFNPYVINLDDAREYLVLVKRRLNGAESANQEELLVVSTDPEVGTIFSATPSEELGAITTVFYANLESDTPRLVIIYGNDNGYTTVTYDLPLTLYTAGDGTAENPYIINSVGGLKQMKAFPDAYFALDGDIDAAGQTLSPSNFEFTGSLDGRNHVIRNLHVTGRAIIPTLMGPESDKPSANGKGTIANLNFVNPVFEANADDQGLVAGEVRYGTISNVHIYGAQMTGTSGIAGITGGAYLYSTIQGCSVDGSIATAEGSAAGIVGKTRTNGSINACAFSGSLQGSTEVGGIVGALESNSGALTNCHVKADIKGHNTIGGIVGSNGARARVAYCHVEGTLEATRGSAWGGGPALGGIVGKLQGNYSSGEEGEETPEPTAAVIENNYVNLTSMTYSGEAAEEEYPGQNDTMHRIAGRTMANDEPEIIGEDEDWNPIYSDTPAAPDAGLKNNYVVSTLSRVNDAIEDLDTTTEGKSVAAGETGMTFFSELGFAYGNDYESPWDATGNPTAPRLFFETGLLTLTPSPATVAVGETLTMTMTLEGMEITEDMLGSFSMAVGDESLLEIGDMEMTSNNAVTLNFKGLAEGVTTVTVYLGNATATAEVTVTKRNGVNDVIGTPGSRIAFDGKNVSALGCRIDIYNASGARVLSGNDTVSTAVLTSGIYIVNATDGEGRRTLKIRVR